MEPEAISIYVHVPFCRRKCDYCHFYVIADDAAKQEALVEALKGEWDRSRALCHGKKVVSVYFGGGTPILLGAAKISSLIAHILATVTVASNCEITLEANPEEITTPLVRALAAGGVNRLSVGLQTHDDSLLHTLGRLHSGAIALGSIEIAAASGIGNISADLMYDLPDQTLAHWEKTLEGTAKLPLQHLSLYNLTIEPCTAFYRKKATLMPRQPQQEVSAAMFKLACSYLQTQGFEHYEISAFAKGKATSRHNIGYWTNRPFLGLGPSAYSFWDGSRYRNIANFDRYCKAIKEGISPVDFTEKLPPEALLRERLVVNLRLLKGIDLTAFPPLPRSLQGAIEELVNDGLLSYTHERLHLTERGLLFYDTVATHLI